MSRASLVRLFLSVVAALTLIGSVASPATASPGALKILIVEGQCDSTVAATLRGQILAQPGVASVDFFNGVTATPSDAQLDAYDVVLAMENCNWTDGVAMGNNLADYQDQGGVVVGATFEWQSGQSGTGRWFSAGYSPYQFGAASAFSTATLGTYDAASPLLAGVSSLSSADRDVPSLNPGATQIANWSDGASAVAFKGDAVAINAYLGDYYPGWTGDFAKIIVNAGNVLGRHILTVTKTGNGSGAVTSTPAGINCGATCAATFNNGTGVTVAATGAGGSAFEGWSGSGCSGTSACTLTMNAAKDVTATFATFDLGKVKRNPKKGTATLSVKVPGPGTLTLGGKGVVKQRPACCARASRSPARHVTAAGTVKLRITAKGKAKKKLTKSGKAKVKVAITFTPAGGTPGRRFETVKLIEKR